MLAAVARRHPDRRYLVSDHRTWTYLEVAEWAGRLAAGLRRHGARPGDRVANALVNGPDRVALEFAISAAGATSVQLSPLLTPREVSDLAARTRSVLVVDTARMHEVEAAGHGVVSEQPAAAGDGLVIFPAAHESGRTALVRLTHDQLLMSAFGSAYTRAFEDARTILFALPLSHVFGYVEGMLAALFCAGAIIPQAGFRTESTLAAIERHGATDALFVPAMALALLRRGVRGHDVTSLTAVMSAGTRAPAWTWAALRETFEVASLTNGYGQTETAASSTLTRPEASDSELAETVGQPKLWPPGPMFDYRAVDTTTGSPLPAGRQGELWVRGATVTRGYEDDAALSRGALRDGWLRSGDLGRVRADGALELTGRLKLLLRTGGENVAPREVEAVLASHADVAEACVVGVADERLGEVIVGLAVPHPGASFDARALRSFCMERLAPHKVPRHFLAMPSLERDRDGEPDRVGMTELASATLRGV